MIPIDPKRLETAFVQPGTPMLSSVIAQVETDPELTPSRRRDILSGLRRMSEALGLPAAEVPAAAAWLQVRLARIAPAAYGLSVKTWSNILSNARAGLVRFGVVEKRISRKSDLSPAWRVLWQIVLDSGDATLIRSLSRFVHFLNRLRVEPHQVADIHAEAYRQALTLNELSRAPEDSWRAAANAWNLAVLRIAEWPRHRLTLPSRRKNIRIDIERFPKEFLADLELFLYNLAQPDPLDELARPRPLRAVSVAQYRNMLLRFASELVHAGIDVREVDSLAAVVRPANAERGLRRILERNGNQPTPGAADIADLLASVGRSHVKLEKGDQRVLDRWKRRLTPDAAPGLTSKNRLRLRPFDDGNTVRRFLRLPEQLFARAENAKTKLQAARLREEAIAIGLLQYLPIRRENLGTIHLESNLERMGDGRVFLVFKEGRVKNRRAIESELPDGLVVMIGAHIATRSPEACPAGTPWLFPRRDGSGPTNLTYLATRVQKRIARELGLQVNMHLFRHIAAKLYLEARPGQYEVVRRLLALSGLSQTLNFYAGFEAGTATRLLAEVLDKARKA